MSEEQSAPTTSPQEPAGDESPPKGFIVLLTQFFVVPLLIVVCCLSVYVAFGLLVGGGNSSRDYLHEVRFGGYNRRWQAAYELSQMLVTDHEAKNDPGLVPEVIAVFEEAIGEDPRIRRYPIHFVRGTCQN